MSSWARARSWLRCRSLLHAHRRGRDPRATSQTSRQRPMALDAVRRLAFTRSRSFASWTTVGIDGDAPNRFVDGGDAGWSRARRRLLCRRLEHCLSGSSAWGKSPGGGNPQAENPQGVRRLTLATGRGFCFFKVTGRSRSWPSGRFLALLRSEMGDGRAVVKFSDSAVCRSLFGGARVSR